MFNAHDFFKNRFSAHIKETSRYLRYMFNGHIAVAMFFLVSALSVYYQQWLAQLPDDFPTAWIMGVVLGIMVSFIPVRTLLKEPDLVFLIPAEHKMNDYFRNALWYSFLLQSFMMLFIFAAFSPLYLHTYPERNGSIYLLSILIILIFNAWNLIANWWMLKVRDTGVRRIDQIVRLLINCLTFFFIFNGNTLLAAVTTSIFIIIFLYDFSVSRKQEGLAWESLVERDRNRMQFFYRIANMFTDVPHFKTKTKKRSWLVSLINRLPLERKSTYDYLYRITFIRSGDYLGMYIRLLIIGILLIIYVPNEWMKVLFAFLFMYMSTFQMMALYHHFRTNIWMDIYPVDHQYRKQAVIKWLNQLAFIQVILFGIVFLVIQHFIGLGMTIIGGILFNFLFIKIYTQQKWKLK